MEVLHRKRMLSLVLVILLLVTGNSSKTYGNTVQSSSSKSENEAAILLSENTNDSYSKAWKHYMKMGYKPAPQGTKVILDSSAITASSNGNIPLKANIGGRPEPTLNWEDTYDWFDWSFEIKNDGLYEIEMEYYPVAGTGSVIQRSLEINGKIPFDEANNIPFQRAWKDDGEPKVNNIGDDVWPKQIEDKAWRKASFGDNQGFYSEPFKFYFTAGKHTIRLNIIDQPIAIGNIIIKSPEIIPAYEEVKAQYQLKGYKDAEEPIKFQAEDKTYIKSDPTIRRENDQDPKTEPRSLGVRKLNVMGAWRWRLGNQYITWTFDVPEDGLYKIDMRLAQWYGDGLPVYRKIAIDGKVPFQEMKEYRFSYDRDWRIETLKDSKEEPYLFYLTKGTHELTMTAVLGPITYIIYSIMEDTLLISEIYRKIIMITGEIPDLNYDYELDRVIPGLMDDLKMLATSMQTNADLLTQISTKRPSAANNFITIRDQLKKMIANPDNIPRGLTDLQNAQRSLGTWIISLKNQPLVIDYFVLNPKDEREKGAKSNFFQRTATTWYNFISSFTKDYDSVGSVYLDDNNDDSTTINVWVSRGKEWAEIMKEMADEDFTQKTGIKVNLNVLPGGQVNAGQVNALMLSITSGKAPDVALGLNADSPVEFAFREAVVDLTQFDDYKEIEKRFYPAIMTPLRYKRGIFGLPETMDFQVLFYRKDIINDLKIGIPSTWDDVYGKVLPTLYQNAMHFHYGAGLAPLLFQMGGTYYKEQGTKSALDSSEAYNAFKSWTDMYLSYGIPVQSDFYNRMRTGEIPMGVANFGQYQQLSVAAPELFGRWDIAPLPGIKKADGTIDRSNASLLANTAVIMNQSKKQKEAWEFLKWWTSSEVQTRFGRELEALLGVEARWNSANKDAFAGLPWNRKHLPIILDAQAWAEEQPVVLGGYFTIRHVNNAFNRVVVSTSMNARDSLEKAVKDINKELRAKQEEYKYKPEDN